MIKSIYFKLLLFIAIFCSYNSVMAQTENQQNSKSIDFAKLETNVPGKFFYKDGKVEDKVILYQNPEELMKLDNQIHFLMDNDDPKRGIINSPKSNLEAFEIDGHMWKRVTHKDEEQFGIIHVDGAILYYSVFNIPFARVTGDYKEETYVRKLDEKHISDAVLLLKYKKTILNLIKDNEELFNKVNSKEKGYKGMLNFEKVIKEYNTWYAEKNKQSL